MLSICHTSVAFQNGPKHNQTAYDCRKSYYNCCVSPKSLLSIGMVTTVVELITTVVKVFKIWSSAKTLTTVAQQLTTVVRYERIVKVHLTTVVTVVTTVIHSRFLNFKNLSSSFNVSHQKKKCFSFQEPNFFLKEKMIVFFIMGPSL